MRRDLRSAMLDASIPPPTSSNKPSHTSGTTSAVIATVVPLLAFIYFVALFGLYRYARRHPSPVNKTSGVRLQRYGPGACHAPQSASPIYSRLSSRLCVYGMQQFG